VINMATRKGNSFGKFVTMQESLLEIETKALLEQFGAGKPTPGAGSAAALVGMLAGNLVGTVSKITGNNIMYAAKHPEFHRIQQDIKLRVLPRLASLLDMDSEEFDKYIKANKLLRVESDWTLTKHHILVVEQQLRVASKLPLEIGGLCYELGNYAVKAFMEGFQEARGDSVLAIRTSLGVLQGCIAIANLNLKDLPGDEWRQSIRTERETLKSRASELEQKAKACEKILERAEQEQWNCEQALVKFRKGNLARSIKNDKELESMVREFQNVLWKYRKIIWKKNGGAMENFSEILNPKEILEKVLGYHMLERESLGYFSNDGMIEVAGKIDKSNKLVEIAETLSKETKLFTVAHELAHALLHDGIRLHRDRAIDGGATISRNAVEMQADKFAALLLMPEKLVRTKFRELFNMPSFILTTNTMLIFGAATDVRAFQHKFPNRRTLSRVLAGPMAVRFGVSVEAMAIRLEELGMIAYL
jgi:formiminotetrahydrofolate cyclodeaminase/Zn-dependent peptidase ImmA (M78 family)